MLSPMIERVSRRWRQEAADQAAAVAAGTLPLEEAYASGAQLDPSAQVAAYSAATAGAVAAGQPHGVGEQHRGVRVEEGAQPLLLPGSRHVVEYRAVSTRSPTRRRAPP